MFECPFDTLFKTAISFLTWVTGFSSCNRSDTEPHTTNHVFPTLHKLLIDDLARIVFSGLDMDGLLDDGICSAAQCLACAVLEQ